MKQRLLQHLHDCIAMVEQMEDKDGVIDRPLTFKQRFETVLGLTYGMTLQDISGRSRKFLFKTLRQIYFYGAHKKGGGTYKEIGAEIGERDHSTVLHGKISVQNCIDTNDEKFMEIYKHFKHLC